MNTPKARCLILGCGNSLRQDDGVGLWLCAWAQDRFSSEPDLRVIARQQWTPDLAEDIALSRSVLFIDCTVESAPGQVLLREIDAAAPRTGIVTHYTDASHLLALAGELYSAAPRKALFLTIGAGSVALGEEFSPAVSAALTDAQGVLEIAVRQLLRHDEISADIPPA